MLQRLDLVPMLAAATLLFGGLTQSVQAQDDPLIELQPNDSVCYIGNTTADRMQHHGWLETYLHALYPNHQLQFRNLGFSGDEVNRRPRSDNFGSPDQWLTKCEADVVFCFFGYNEALRGAEGLADFRKNLEQMIDGMRAQRYNGKSPPRIVLFSPIAHEDLKSPHLPDGKDNNVRLEAYTAAMGDVARVKEVPFVDLYQATTNLYATTKEPLTLNGIHLLDTGNRVLAQVIMQKLFPQISLSKFQDLTRLREAVLDKNYYWFSRYRVVDGYNVYGGRSKLAWHDQSNADVMRREMEIFDVMTGNRDQRVWAVAKGDDLTVKDDNIPAELAVKTNKPGPNEDQSWPYLSGEDAISKMKIHEGMEVNLFASEEQFPRLSNPVQMAVDTDSRLWVSVWPSYPHWNPTQPRKDALLILPDEDGDGKADECIVFADELNSVTGFEFWGGGVLVAAPPEIWFLKDTDGDDRADVKLRMLQGVSSADTHHSANAVLVGPDGWLYWSRGIFNVANFETPTKTYRSGQSGVHRFNPRTFEVEFHFPIGPNPHGDVFDQWGYQFASDGTSGTGSYINIGKGMGNKQWYQKRVRPVPAIGILSSSHFPPELNGNFLISNAIGFLGVLQHTVHYNGADITAKEIDPILVSSDPNFRPSDLEIGGDGALYVSDWHNTLIGHMQHNMRDPNRDTIHGRVYRVTCTGRELLKPAKMKDKPIRQVCENFFSPENGTRYRARLELSGRDRDLVKTEVGAFAEQLDPAKAELPRNESQALLECLWVFEEQRMPDPVLVKKVFQSQEARVRAAAIRTLGHWAGRVDDWEPVLLAAAKDDAALVRAEALKAAVGFQGDVLAEVFFEAAGRESDPELASVIKYARDRIPVEAIVKKAIENGGRLSPAGYAYALENASVADLFQLPKSAEVFRAVLARANANQGQLARALGGLSEVTGDAEASLLMQVIQSAQDTKQGNLAALGELLRSRSREELATVREQIEQLATAGTSKAIKRVGYAAWVAAAGPDDAFLAASQSKEALRDFLDAVPTVDPGVRGQLYAKVKPLIFGLPVGLGEASASSDFRQPGIEVDYFFPHQTNVARETLEKLKPLASGVVPEIVMNVPQRKEADRFALRFRGRITVPRTGEYTFYIASDDGSRVYVAGKQVINHDGLHGMSEKQGKITLAAGSHDLLVTYYDNGGGDGLRVAWAGPGFSKQKIDPSALSLGGGESLRDVAIRALASIPGNEKNKFEALASLVAAGKNRPAAIAALKTLDSEHRAAPLVPGLIDNLLGYLSEMPARFRTSGPAMDAVALTRSLAKGLPAARADRILARLENLDVRVIAIGTVAHRMIYDKELIAVQAGKTVEFRFSNTDAMPHNFAITQPGALQEVGELAEATGRDADAQARNYIPKSKKILLASGLLQPGQEQALTFEVPDKPGVYPYVCTYPGHWRRMYGALYVVENLDEYQADSENYLAANPLPIQDELLTLNTRSHAWTYDELAAEVKEMPGGRSFEVGKELFKVASCVGCHKLDNEGRVFGPDLAKLEKKKHTLDHILMSIVEPSKEIEEKYQSHMFLLDSGKIITGMILKETGDQVEVVIDPLAKGAATVIEKDEIEEQQVSKISMMPKGLLDKLSREEILDLIAFVFAKGDKQNKLYGEHQHH